MSDNPEALRAAFEQIIAGPPYERDVRRFADDGRSAWPGNYRDINVDLAWCVLREYTEAPAQQAATPAPQEEALSDNPEALRLAQELQRTEATGIPLTVRGREIINELVTALAQQEATPAELHAVIADLKRIAGEIGDHTKRSLEVAIIQLSHRAHELSRAALAHAVEARKAATPTDAREVFEAWLGREEFTERSDSGKYVSAHVDAMWSAWRAALAQQAATPAPAEPTVEALEYLFLAIATNADSDYRFRALRRAESALEKAMPGWTSPVPSVAAYKA